MIVDADLSGLEWRVGAELSRDPTMIAEIVDGADIHMANSRAIFGDELHRQDSKTVSFRSLYGGTAYAFFADPKMPNFSLRRWEEIYTVFYAKYNVLGQWQNTNFECVGKTGQLQTFTGRIYRFQKTLQHDGSMWYNKPDVCNYPCQGTATADIVPMIMNLVFKRLRELNLHKEILFINQVHDSLVFDCPKKHIDILAETCIYYFENIPKYVKLTWDYDWSVPMKGEVKYGPNWSNMVTYGK